MDEYTVYNSYEYSDTLLNDIFAKMISALVGTFELHIFIAVFRNRFTDAWNDGISHESLMENFRVYASNGKYPLIERAAIPTGDMSIGNITSETSSVKTIITEGADIRIGVETKIPLHFRSFQLDPRCGMLDAGYIGSKTTAGEYTVTANPWGDPDGTPMVGNTYASLTPCLDIEPNTSRSISMGIFV